MSSTAIALYEVRRLYRDRALPALLLLLLGLGMYAAWNGLDWTSQRQAAIDVIEAREQASLADSRERIGQPGSSVVLPIPLPVLPPGAMAPLSVGQADAYPFHAEVVPLGDYSHLFRRVWADIGNPTARAAGRFDLAFLIVFLLPLVILAATHDLWSRERERGIAAMVLSQPVAVGSLIAVKAAARGLAVLSPAVAVVLAVAAWAGAREPAGLTVLALIVLAYGGFWLAVATVISLLARRSTEAAIAAGAVWLLIVVMAPSLTLAAVDLAAPPPSEMRFATEFKARHAQITERQRLHRAANPAPVRTPAPTLPDRLRETAADRMALDLELMPLVDAQLQAREARRRVLDKARFLLPSVAAQDALDRIAGSDADRALAFQSQVLAARDELRRLLEGYLDRDSPPTLAEYEAVPVFRFRETGGAFQAGVLADLAALVGAMLLILIAARGLRGRAATP